MLNGDNIRAGGGIKMKHLIHRDHLAKLVSYGKPALRVIVSVILMLLSLLITDGNIKLCRTKLLRL